GTVVLDVSDDSRLTLNAYYLDFEGPSTNYNHVSGPTDYRDNVRMNVIGWQAFDYTGANAKLEFPLDALKTKVTAIAAYDKREIESVSDGDFLSLDIVRADGTGTDETYTGELRFDTEYSDTFSTLIGLYASRGVGCDFRADTGSGRSHGDFVRRSQRRHLLDLRDR